MLKRSNPQVAKLATVTKPEKLNELGVVYGTVDLMGRPHLLMSQRDWRRATRAGAVTIQSLS